MVVKRPHGSGDDAFHHVLQQKKIPGGLDVSVNHKDTGIKMGSRPNGDTARFGSKSLRQFSVEPDVPSSKPKNDNVQKPDKSKLPQWRKDLIGTKPEKNPGFHNPKLLAKGKKKSSPPPKPDLQKGEHLQEFYGGYIIRDKEGNRVGKVPPEDVSDIGLNLWNSLYNGSFGSFEAYLQYEAPEVWKDMQENLRGNPPRLVAPEGGAANGFESILDPRW